MLKKNCHIKAVTLFYFIHFNNIAEHFSGGGLHQTLALSHQSNVIGQH